MLSIELGDCSLYESPLLKMRSLNCFVLCMYIDLPRLQNITAQYSSLSYVSSVVLESMLVMWLSTLDIPNLVHVELPDAFSYVAYKKIKSIFILCL